VVRAKSTDRAEARRRHRAATAAAVAESPSLAVPSGPTRTSTGGPASGGPPRSGIFGSFRNAIRPVHFREDLLDLPRVATRTFAIWVPCLLILAVFALFEASGGNIANQSVQALAFNLFIFPPPLAAAFLAGILTQRSSYLAGGIVGLLAGILFATYVLSATFAPANGVAVTSDIRLQNAFYALLVSPVTGVAVGGFAGFIQRVARIIVA
jgi:hypothetical protein